MSNFKKIGGRYGMHSGSAKFKNLEVTEGLYWRGTPLVSSIGGKNVTIKFVDASVSQSGNGDSWDNAYKTILEATAACRDDYSDDAAYYIFIAPGSYDETEDIRLYGHGIHLIGLGNPGSDSGVNVSDTNCTNGTFLLAGANCTIANIKFIPTQDLPPIFAIAAGNCLISNCHFKGVSGTTTNAIKTMNVRSTVIEDCQFGAAGEDFEVTIYAEGGADQYLIDSVIRNNRIFSNTTGAKGIYLDSQSTLVTYGCVIDRNHINLSGAGSTAKGIDSDNTGLVMITDNYVQVDASATPIESAATGGILGNHTDAGGTVVDPNAVAS